MMNLLKTASLYLCCLLILTACGTTRPSHFYLLTPLAQNEGDRQNSEPGIVIGPVTLPDYLLRPQIVLRNDENEITFDEFHRWAEPLHGNFSRVLAENLSRLLDTSRIALYPGYKTSGFPCQVLVDVIRMDAGSGQQITLVARWSILDRDQKKQLASSKISVVEPIDGTGYKAIVSAQSRALSRLSHEIARAFKETGGSFSTDMPSPCPATFARCRHKR